MRIGLPFPGRLRVTSADGHEFGAYRAPIINALTVVPGIILEQPVYITVVSAVIIVIAVVLMMRREPTPITVTD